MPTAPTAASAISTFMSSERRAARPTAARAIGQPPTAIDARYSGSATARGAPASDGDHRDASSSDRRRRRHRPRVAAPERRRRLAACAASAGRARYPARADRGRHARRSTSPCDDQRRVPNDTSRRAHAVERGDDLLDRPRARRAVHALDAVAAGPAAGSAPRVRRPSAAPGARVASTPRPRSTERQRAAGLGQRVHHHLARRGASARARRRAARARDARPASPSAPPPTRGRTRTARRRRRAARPRASAASGRRAPSPAPPPRRRARRRGAAARSASAFGRSRHRRSQLSSIPTS